MVSAEAAAMAVAAMESAAGLVANVINTRSIERLNGEVSQLVVGVDKANNDKASCISLLQVRQETCHGASGTWQLLLQN
ncbi:hypothetical protein VIGAN_01174300 [Vigna angularis var. angularis]|uniref:Uncharacterized protein n=1 Tax=Vigna angularis var. angularis TaxID=157739 RepID=A0A0S3R0Q0_PHAAN|nr:hypothetical protein VIGAN_01174300 [Vigna angularis var. angularis]